MTSRQFRPVGRLSVVIRGSGLPAAGHGGPVPCGGPSGPGISDLGRPDFGDPWVLAITHAPERTLPGDVRDERFRVA